MLAPAPGARTQRGAIAAELISLLLYAPIICALYARADKLEGDMQPAIKFVTGIVTAVIGTAIVFFLTLAMNSLTIPSAQATPAIGKGKPCETCHTGSPPTKDNVKK
ncbi:MAG: hypothetical protein ACRET6_01835 [Burkholderiales bacterium]